MGWGDYGFFPGLFASPRGIAVHQGLLLVAEAFSHRVQAFDLDGSFLYQWGLHAVVPREGEGKIHYPQGVAVAPDGSFVAVVEPFEDRCQLFGPLGGQDESAPVSPAPSSAVSHFGPQLDVSGRWLAVHEPEQGSLSIFDLSHEVPILVSTVGEPGRRVGQLSRRGRPFDRRHAGAGGRRRHVAAAALPVRSRRRGTDPFRSPRGALRQGVRLVAASLRRGRTGAAAGRRGPRRRRKHLPARRAQRSRARVHRRDEAAAQLGRIGLRARAFPRADGSSSRSRGSGSTWSTR